jgi:hypothetical protein
MVCVSFLRQDATDKLIIPLIGQTNQEGEHFSLGADISHLAEIYRRGRQERRVF